MMVLIIGPNSSGKSVYAERLAGQICKGELYYVATLLPYGKEGKDRVEKHRKQRFSMGFVTVESPYAVADVNEEDTVLLEDISNLAANLMFVKGVECVSDTVLECVTNLRNDCDHLICVSISGLDFEDAENEETRHYIANLQKVNEKLFVCADVVVELKSGMSTIRKGNFPWKF